MNKHIFLQGLHPAIDDFIVKSTKLDNQIRSTSFAFSAFLESFQKIAHKASNTKGNALFQSVLKSQIIYQDLVVISVLV